jgi:putative transcriptional regulator
MAGSSAKVKQRRAKAGSPRSSRAQRASVGSQIAARLAQFADRLEALPRDVPLSTQFTVRTVKLNLQPQVPSPALVRQTRQMLAASQAVFAQFLGVGVSTVQDWEQGQKPPRGSACRLMDEIRRDPEYWRERLRSLAGQSA